MFLQSLQNCLSDVLRVHNYQGFQLLQHLHQLHQSEHYLLLLVLLGKDSAPKVDPGVVDLVHFELVVELLEVVLVVLHF